MACDQAATADSTRGEKHARSAAGRDRAVAADRRPIRSIGLPWANMHAQGGGQQAQVT